MIPWKNWIASVVISGKTILQNVVVNRAVVIEGRSKSVVISKNNDDMHNIGMRFSCDRGMLGLSQSEIHSILLEHLSVKDICRGITHNVIETQKRFYVTKLLWKGNESTIHCMVVSRWTESYKSCSFNKYFHENYHLFNRSYEICGNDSFRENSYDGMINNNLITKSHRLIQVK